MRIRRLTPDDAEIFRQLRLEALKTTPTAFGSSHKEEEKRSIEAFQQVLSVNEQNWVFGAFERESLMGVVRLVRESQEKEKHKAGIYGMYVSLQFRRRGVGRALLNAALDVARSMSGLRQIRLAVEGSNVPAIKLYEEFGFVQYGLEEGALFVEGQFYAERLMVKYVS